MQFSPLRLKTVLSKNNIRIFLKHLFHTIKLFNFIRLTKLYFSKEELESLENADFMVYISLDHLSKKAILFKYTIRIVLKCLLLYSVFTSCHHKNYIFQT